MAARPTGAAWSRSPATALCEAWEVGLRTWRRVRFPPVLPVVADEDHLPVAGRPDGP